MSAPKSVTKVIKKQGKAYVEYTADVDVAKYYIYELSRAAMRDVGKYVKKVWQMSYDGIVKKHSGRGRKATSYTVVAGKFTLFPRVQIGLKAGKSDASFYAYMQEFGSSTMPRQGLLTKAVKDNIDQIIEIESKYLSELNGDNPSVDESEYNDED